MHCDSLFEVCGDKSVVVVNVQFLGMAEMFPQLFSVRGAQCDNMAHSCGVTDLKDKGGGERCFSHCRGRRGGEQVRIMCSVRSSQKLREISPK